MKKITKSIHDTSAIDFYDTLTPKQREKFDNEKESFTIDFIEISNIYANLNAEQTRTLIIAIAMYAATGKKSEIDKEILDALNNDPKVLIQFNNMANRVKNNTKAWLNGRGQSKNNEHTPNIPDVEYDSDKECWKANETKAVKKLLKEHGETIEKLNDCLQFCYPDPNFIPDIFASDFDMW